MDFLTLRRKSPQTAGEWIVFTLAIAASMTVDGLLKRNFPEMTQRVRRGLSSIPTIVILLLYFFVIRK